MLTADQALASEGVLVVPSVSKTFAGTTVLRSVGLTLRAGEVRGLAGLNGSGKSTLIKLLAGVYQPDEKAFGQVGRHQFAIGNHDEAHRVGLRFVHQDLGLINSLNAVDNVALGASYRLHRVGSIDWRRTREKVREVLAEIGYDFDVTAPVGHLTAPQRTGVAIARALNDWTSGERVLILDEPTASLPLGETRNLFSAIDRVRRRGVPVLIVTHHLDEVLAVTDSVTVLRNGSIRTTRTTSGLDHDQLVELMVGHPIAGRASNSVRAESGSRRVLGVVGLSTKTIKSIDLEVAQGEIVGVAGLAGSGRDELLPALVGTARRTGSVTLGDVLLPPSRPARAIALGVGYVPADRRRDGIFPTFDVRANLTIAELGNVQRRSIISRRLERDEAKRVIGRFNIVPQNPAANIMTLSGGNQQKAIVARSLRRTPKLMMLDEPTQGVDVAARESVYEAIRAATCEGAVLVSSSDLEELSGLCDRVYVFYQGRVVAEVSRGRSNPEALEALCLAGVVNE